MKLLALLTCVGFLSFVATAIFAESLSVFSEDSEAKIYVDGRHVGLQDLVGYEVSPGEHLVKVVVAQGTAYSQIVMVNKGESKVVNTTRFVPVTSSAVPDRAAKLIEAERLRVSRGNFGIGWELGPISGISVRYDLDPQWGLGVLGWTSKTDNGASNSIQGNFYYTFVNTIVNDQVSSLYLCGSLGNADATGSTVRAYSVASLSVGLLSGTPSGNSYSFLEVGYGSVDHKSSGTSFYYSDEDYTGVIFKAGAMYFF